MNKLIFILIMTKDGILLKRFTVSETIEPIPNINNYIFANNTSYKVHNIVFDYDNQCVKVYVEKCPFAN